MGSYILTAGSPKYGVLALAILAIADAEPNTRFLRDVGNISAVMTYMALKDNVMAPFPIRVNIITNHDKSVM